MDNDSDNSPVVFISYQGQRPGIEISMDQISPGAVARAFSVSCYEVIVASTSCDHYLWSCQTIVMSHAFTKV